MRMIEVHNQEAEEGKHTFTMGMNEFSDLVSLDTESCKKNKNINYASS